jgi:large subunit ribosomal protein L13
MVRTYQPKQKEVSRNWFLVDMSKDSLGRQATKIASFLMGKHKPTYSAHMDMGDWVVVVNAKKLKLTGNKASQKVYRSHSGYPGGFKEVKIGKLLEEQPEKIVYMAVKGMLPNNRLSKGRINRLKIFADDKHPYEDKLKGKS